MAKACSSSAAVGHGLYPSPFNGIRLRSYPHGVSYLRLKRNTTFPVISATATILDGKLVGQQMMKEIREEVRMMKGDIGVVPGLAEILVGDHAFEELVLEYIDICNNHPNVHGILLPLPLPKHINKQRILDAINPKKDVDSFFDGGPSLVPSSCTAEGCRKLLHTYNINIKSKQVIMIGGDDIVHALTTAHMLAESPQLLSLFSSIDEVEEFVRKADIVISAIGKPNSINSSMIKPGAVVIDLGFNATENDIGSCHGYRFIGDVCYDEVSKIASAITPVPCGVGPMSVAMLLSNTLRAAKAIHNFH